MVANEKSGIITEVRSNIPKTSGSKEAAVFLNEFNFKLIEQCINYFEATSETPFQYTEKQWQGILLLALSQLSKAVVVEFPVYKGHNHGWADYFALYLNRGYLIELKRWGLSYRATSAIRKTSQKSWENSIDALKDAQVSKIFDKFDNVKTISKIALNIVPMVDRSNNSDRLLNRSYKPEMIIKKYERVYNALKPEPHWMSILIPQNGLAEIMPTKRDSSKRYPGVALFARVDVINRK